MEKNSQKNAIQTRQKAVKCCGQVSWKSPESRKWTGSYFSHEILSSGLSSG